MHQFYMTIIESTLNLRSLRLYVPVIHCILTNCTINKEHESAIDI